MNSNWPKRLVNTGDNLQIRQSVIDFSDVAKKLRIKEALFSFPNKVLKLLYGDDNISDDISIEAKSLVNKILDLNENLQDLKQRYIDAWFWFQSSNGSLARSITDYTFDFTEDQISDLQELPSLIEQFYKDRIELLNCNKEIQEMFWIQDTDVVSNLEVPIFTRLDMVIDPDWKLQLVEIEPIYAGLGETMGTRDVYNNLNEVDPNFPWLQKSYIRALDRLDWKNVLFCPNPKLSWYFTEVEYLFDCLKNENNTLKKLSLTLDVDNLVFMDEGIYFEWEKLDVLMNYYIPKEQWEISELDNKIIEQFKKWNIKLFPEPSLELDSKLWLALAWDDRFFSDLKLYDKFIPNTTIYNRDIPIEGDKMLKRISSNITKEDFFDTSKGYDKELIIWDSKPWIIQDKLDTQTNKVILLNRKWKIEEKSMYSRIEVYITFPETWAELWDILVTMSPKQIVKWWRECVMVPATTKV
jgi:hypothetical protein